MKLASIPQKFYRRWRAVCMYDDLNSYEMMMMMMNG